MNRDLGYVWRREDFHWLPGAERAVKRLNDAGYLVFVVSNQAGIARGLYQPGDVERLHLWLNGELGAAAPLSTPSYCPHHPTEGQGVYRQACDCRKPAPGMLLRAMREWPVDRGKAS